MSALYNLRSAEIALQQSDNALDLHTWNVKKFKTSLAYTPNKDTVILFSNEVYDLAI